jgi:hypothetical protein
VNPTVGIRHLTSFSELATLEISHIGDGFA